MSGAEKLPVVDSDRGSNMEASACSGSTVPGASSPSTTSHRTLTVDSATKAKEVKIASAPIKSPTSVPSTTSAAPPSSLLPSSYPPTASSSSASVPTSSSHAVHPTHHHHHHRHGQQIGAHARSHVGKQEKSTNLRKAKTKMDEEKTLERQRRVEALLRRPEERTREDVLLLEDCLLGVKFFQMSDRDTRLELCRAVQYESFEPGYHVFREGDKGEKFYIILKGAVSVRHRDPMRQVDVTIATLQEGHSFGELALLQGTRTKSGKTDSSSTAATASASSASASTSTSDDTMSNATNLRTASVLCTDRSEFLVLHRQDYNKILNSMINKDIAEKVKFLRNVKTGAFRDLTTERLESLSGVLNLRRYPKNGILVRQGDDADELFFIKRGECRIVKEMEMSPRLLQELAMVSSRCPSALAEAMRSSSSYERESSGCSNTSYSSSSSASYDSTPYGSSPMARSGAGPRSRSKYGADMMMGSTCGHGHGHGSMGKHGRNLPQLHAMHPLRAVLNDYFKQCVPYRIEHNTDSGLVSLVENSPSAKNTLGSNSGGGKQMDGASTSSGRREAGASPLASLESQRHKDDATSQPANSNNVSTASTNRTLFFSHSKEARMRFAMKKDTDMSEKRIEDIEKEMMEMQREEKSRQSQSNARERAGKAKTGRTMNGKARSRTNMVDNGRFGGKAASGRVQQARRQNRFGGGSNSIDRLLSPQKLPSLASPSIRASNATKPIRVFLEVGLLSANDIFGEMGVTIKSKRACSVIANCAVEVFVLNKWDLQRRLHDSVLLKILGKVSTYQTDEELQKEFISTLRWMEFKQSLIKDVLGHARS